MRMNVVFFGGSLAVAFLNYLYYPVLGRLLDKQSFGETQMLVSLFLQLSIVLSVLGLVVVNIVVNQRDNHAASMVIRELEKAALLVGGAMVVLTVLFSGLLKDMFKFSGTLEFILLAVVFLVTIPLTFRTAFLRGKQSFGAVSISGGLAAFAKLIFSVGLVLFGAATNGAIGGILVAQLLAFFYTARLAGRRGYQPGSVKSRRINWDIVRPQLRFAGFAGLVSLSVMVLFSVDAVIVKYLFTPEVAGAYAGISTVARIIYFLTASIAIVLLSSISQKSSATETRSLLKRSLLLTIAIGGSAALVFTIFPGFVVGILMGNGYQQFVDLLPLLSLTTLLLAAANVLASYHMALRHYRIVYAVIAVLVLLAILLFVRHETVRQIVENLAIVTSVLVALLGFGARFLDNRSV